MTQSIRLSKGRIALAFTIAALADFIQLPLTAATMTGWLAIPAEAADVMVDMAVAAVMTGLLGFHWILLPTFLLEAVPFVDVLPTWTGCVAFVVWRRHSAGAANPASPPQPAATRDTNMEPDKIIDVEATVSRTRTGPGQSSM